MTNEKNNNNELVFDDDPTAELEVMKVRRDLLSSVAAPLKFDDYTSDLTSEVSDDSRAISGLEHDIEQLRARSLGLEAEIKTREEVTATLTARLNDLRDSLALKNDILESRDAEIESLKSELRNEKARFLAAAAKHEIKIENLHKPAPAIPEPPASWQTQDGAPHNQSHLGRLEAYADSLRRKLQDLLASNDDLKRENEHLETSLQLSHEYGQQLAADLAGARENKNALEKEVASITDKHAKEIQLLRFELGEAQDTVVQGEELNSQLASDLVDTCGFKDDLERMLCDHHEKSRARIDELENELGRTRRIAEELDEKLKARGDAINAMLAELARNPEQVDSIGEIGDVISDIGELISEKIDEGADRSTHANRMHDRLTRMLLSKAGDKLLRFPLFKDRLTIGRTTDNDIHLSAAYISRRHAVVQTDGNATRVIDWGSRNGVFVNSKRVTEHFLKSGDIVTIGNVHFRYDERPKRNC